MTDHGAIGTQRLLQQDGRVSIVTHSFHNPLEGRDEVELTLVAELGQ
jgi:hypothetical protein